MAYVFIMVYRGALWFIMRERVESIDCDILHEYICIWWSVRLISIIWPYLICARPNIIYLKSELFK